MTTILADLRYAVRILRRSPLLTTMAVTSMALAIGANAAVFTLVDQVLLRTLPAKDPHQIVQVTTSGDFYAGSIGDGTGISYPLYVDLRDNNQVFAGMFSNVGLNMHLGVGNESERVRGELVTGSYFPVLGVGPAIGRTLTPDDDRAPGGHPLVVLSYAYWSSRFASDPGVIGRTVVANGLPMTVVGVAARGFDGTDIGQPTQVFVPMAMHSGFAPGWLEQDDRRFRWLHAFGRLRDGVTREQAAAGLQPFYRSLLERDVGDKSFANASPDAKRRHLETRIELVPAAHGRSTLRQYVTRPLWILMAMVGGVLLIACANVANLLIARGMARQREIALRLALGASRRRVVQQLIAEGLVLAALGGAAGLVLATWGAGLLIAAYSMADNPLTISSGADLRILAFTFAIVALTTLLSGLLPAFQSTRPELAPSLKEGAISVLGGQRAGLRKALVATQVALSLVLLIGAGLFVRSLYQLLSVDPGYNVTRVVQFSVDLERNGYQLLRTKQFAKDLLQGLGETPGVQSAAFAAFGLLEGGGWGMGITVEGYQPKPGDRRGSWLNAVSPGYFKTLQLPLVAGREFTARDELTTRNLSFENTGTWRWPFRVAVVNETFVKRYLGGRNPLGVHIGIGDDPGTPTPAEIIGIAVDSKYGEIREEPAPQIFFPALEHDAISELTAYVRTTRDPKEMTSAVRRVVQKLDPTLPVFNVRTFEEQLARSLTNERLFASLSTAFGVLATLLAAVGLYGVMAYAVTRRTREIGIRIALGARGSQVAWRILREATVLVGIGLGLGLGAAWWLTRFVESQLYGVTPHDPWTLAACVVALTAIAGLAVWVPARRAARTDPLVALRSE
jgi:predicted permease